VLESDPAWPFEFTEDVLVGHTPVRTFWNSLASLTALLNLLVNSVAAQLGGKAVERFPCLPTGASTPVSSMQWQAGAPNSSRSGGERPSPRNGSLRELLTGYERIRYPGRDRSTSFTTWPPIIEQRTRGDF
jgi:hypothetical protein